MAPTRPCVWIFDLDDTLHDAGVHIFPHINRSMTAYVAERLQLPEDEASLLRTQYWHRYGATLIGLMRHHGTNPQHFLWHTHQFPDLASLVVFEPALNQLLRRLPGRKVLFSNSPRHYAEAVLRVMGIASHFSALWAIEHTRFSPKPMRAGFHGLLRRHGLDPGRCIMVEDTPRNLLTAKQLGMKTVLISRQARRPGFVDVRIKSVLDLPRVLNKIKM